MLRVITNGPCFFLAPAFLHLANKRRLILYLNYSSELSIEISRRKYQDEGCKIRKNKVVSVSYDNILGELSAHALGLDRRVFFENGGAVVGKHIMHRHQAGALGDGDWNGRFAPHQSGAFLLQYHLAHELNFIQGCQIDL